MINRLILYNNYHNGDIHFSREFIKYLVSHIPAKEYYCAHAYFPKLLREIKNLGHLTKDAVSHLPNDEFIYRQDNDYFINVWIGVKNLKYLNMVTSGKLGWLEANHQMFSDMIDRLNEVGIRVPPPSKMTDYIPDIDYSCYDIERIKPITKDMRFKVLICNGYVYKPGKYPFNFERIIQYLLQTYPNFLFFHTAPSKVKHRNLIFTDNLIQASDGDLNEISYLSQFCRIIIGRGSGPFCFSEVKSNYFDKRKRFFGIKGAFPKIGAKGVFWYYPSGNSVFSPIFNVELFDSIVNELIQVKML